MEAWGHIHIRLFKELICMWPYALYKTISSCYYEFAMRQISVQDIMTKDVVSVKPITSLSEAAHLLAEHGFDGVPVVDEHNQLVGILTEYDLVSKGSAIHIPTFQTILENLSVFRKDDARFKSEVAELTSLKVKDIMNNDPLTLRNDAAYEEVVVAFRDHHRVNPIPVINENRTVVGVVSRFDVLKPLREVA